MESFYGKELIADYRKVSMGKKVYWNLHERPHNVVCSLKHQCLMVRTLKQILNHYWKNCILPESGSFKIA